MKAIRKAGECGGKSQHSQWWGMPLLSQVGADLTSGKWRAQDLWDQGPIGLYLKKTSRADEDRQAISGLLPQHGSKTMPK